MVLLWCQIVLLWHQVTMVESEQHLYQTVVLPRRLATGSIRDYLFCYCPLVGILFEVLRIVFVFHHHVNWARGTSVKLCIYQYTLTSLHTGGIKEYFRGNWNAPCVTSPPPPPPMFSPCFLWASGPLYTSQVVSPTLLLGLIRTFLGKDRIPGSILCFICPRVC